MGFEKNDSFFDFVLVEISCGVKVFSLKDQGADGEGAAQSCEADAFHQLCEECI